MLNKKKLKKHKKITNQTRDASYKSRNNSCKPIKPANRAMRMILPHKKKIEKIYKFQL
jgi:hypothetical protein